MEDPIKKLIKETAKETQKHFDAKAEETQKHFDFMADEVKGHVDEKAEETQRHFGVIAEDMKSDFRAVAEQVAANSVTLTKVQETLVVMQDDIAFIKNGLKQKVDHDEFVTLEKRVALLEARRS